jgi:hypothetical protein
MARSVKLDEGWVRRIIEQIQDLTYGSVQITVHGGQIVQVERTEKQRLDSPLHRGRGHQGGYR